MDSNLISNSLEVLRYNTTDSSKAKTISQCLHTKLLKVWHILLTFIKNVTDQLIYYVNWIEKSSKFIVYAAKSRVFHDGSGFLYWQFIPGTSLEKGMQPQESIIKVEGRNKVEVSRRMLKLSTSEDCCQGTVLQTALVPAVCWMEICWMGSPMSTVATLRIRLDLCKHISTCRLFLGSFLPLSLNTEFLFFEFITRLFLVVWRGTEV